MPEKASAGIGVIDVSFKKQLHPAGDCFMIATRSVHVSVLHSDHGKSLVVKRLTHCHNSCRSEMEMEAQNASPQVRQQSILLQEAGAMKTSESFKI